MLKVDCENRFVRINMDQCGNREIHAAWYSINGCSYPVRVERSETNPERFAIGPFPTQTCNGVANLMLATDYHCYEMKINIDMAPGPETPQRHIPTFQNMNSTIVECCQQTEDEDGSAA